MKNKALIESAAKSVFSNVPFAGTLLNEIFFDYRSRVKQERLNLFLEGFINYLEAGDLMEITENLLLTEDFGDLFESVIRRVTQTSSEERLQMFKNVLAGYITEPQKNDYQDTFLDIIDRINATQIQILKAHNLIKEDIRKLLRQREYYNQELGRLNSELANEKRLMNEGKTHDYYEKTKEIMGLNQYMNENKEEIEQDTEIRKPSHYEIKEGEYLFLLQDLASKGLLMDVGIGALDTKPFDKMAITDFGKAFLDYVQIH